MVSNPKNPTTFRSGSVKPYDHSGLTVVLMVVV